MPDEPMLITRSTTVDGVTTHSLQGEWPSRTRIARSIFTDGNPDLIRRDGDEVFVTLSNGSATYRVVLDDEYRDEIVCDLAESHA